ncbi:MAG: phage tail tape measure protein, partial [Blastopirellula sp.]
MPDIAHLVMIADTRQLKPGVAVLEDVTAAGGRAEKATDGTSAGFVRAGRSASVASPKIIRASVAMDAVGISAANAVRGIGAFAAGLVSLSAAQNAISQARDFHSALAETSTLIAGNAEQMALLESESRKLARTYGGEAAGQVRGYYQALSAGAMSVADASAIMTTANELAIGGLSDITTSVGILSGVLNSYGRDVMTASAVSDALFIGMQEGVTNISELSSQIGNVIPLAKAMGLSFDETVAATAALTLNTMTTSSAVTSLGAILTAVSGPTAEASKLAKSLGLEFSATALETKGLAAFLADVSKKSGGGAEAMRTLFGSAEAMKGALLFAGEAGGQLANILEEMEGKAGAASAAFELVAAELEQRLVTATGKFRNAALGVGIVLLSGLVPVLEIVGDNIGLISSTAAVAAAMFAGKFAISLGVTAVTAISSAISQTIALEIALGATTISSARASAGIKLFSRSLVALRGALITTGIGALIVGAGYLVNKFLELVDKTGSWGNALGLLGGVAKGVWQGITTSASAIGPALGAVWQTVQSGFFKMLGYLTSKWSAFLNVMANGADFLPMFGDISESLRSAADAASLSVANYDAKVQAAATSSALLRSKTKSLVLDGYDMARGYLKRLSTEQDAANEAIKNGVSASDGLATALTELGDNALDPVTNSLGGAGAAAKEMTEKLSGPPPSAIDSVSGVFGDFVAGGLHDFEGFTDGVLNSFKRMLSEMIALSAKNKIIVSLGMAGGLTGTGATAGTVSTSGSVSGATGILSSLTGVGGALAGGFMNSASALFGAGGGIGTMFTGIGAQIGTAIAHGSLTSIAGAVGTIALPVAAVVAAISFFKTKTKQLDDGLRITADTMGTFVDRFETINKKKFWGLSNKTYDVFSGMDPEFTGPIIAAIGQLQSGLVDLGETMGLTEADFASFSHTVTFSLKGLTDEQAQARIIAEMEGFSEAYAAAALGWFDESLIGGVVRNGETFRDTMVALSGSLQLVNGTFAELGFNLFDTSVAGAKASRDFADALGGWESFAQGISNYVDTFYSDGEKLEIITDRVSRALAGLTVENRGTAMDSRENFKALTDWLGRGSATVDGQADIFAALINTSGLIDQMFSLQESLVTTEDVVADVVDELSGLNAIAQEAASLLLREARLKGDTIYVREQELAGIDVANRAILERIFGLEDEAEASSAAATAVKELAAVEKARASEAENLTSRYEKLMGDTSAIRARELAGLNESNRHLLDLIFAREDEVAGIDAAAAAADVLTDAMEAQAQKATEIANERAGLDRQILELLGDTNALRQLEIAAVDQSNQDLILRIHALRDEADASQLATVAAANAADVEAKRVQAIEQAAADLNAQIKAVADETFGLQGRWLEAIGDTAALRERELAALDPTNQALLLKIWAYQDEAAAADVARIGIESLQASMDEAAIAAETLATAIANEGYQLETRLLTLQGETLALRERELALLYPVNREMQELIWSLEDAEVSAADTASAMDDAANAMERLRTGMHDALSDVERLINAEIRSIQSATDAQVNAMRGALQIHQDAADAARGTMDASMAIFRASVDAKRTSLTNAYQTSLERLNTSMQSAQDRASSFRSVFSTLVSAFDARSLDSFASGYQRFQSGRSFLSNAARTGSYGEDGLKTALDAVKGGGAGYFSTAAEFEHAYSQTSAAIKTLKDGAEGQLSSAELQVDLLSSQISAAERAHTDNMDRLDAQIVQAQNIVDGVTGATLQVMAVETAIEHLQLAAEVYQRTSEQVLAETETTNDLIDSLESQASIQIAYLNSQLSVAHQMVNQLDSAN